MFHLKRYKAAGSSVHIISAILNCNWNVGREVLWGSLVEFSIPLDVGEDIVRGVWYFEEPAVSVVSDVGLDTLTVLHDPRPAVFITAFVTFVRSFLEKVTLIPFLHRTRIISVSFSIARRQREFRNNNPKSRGRMLKAEGQELMLLSSSPGREWDAKKRLPRRAGYTRRHWWREWVGCWVYTYCGTFYVPSRWLCEAGEALDLVSGSIDFAGYSGWLKYRIVKRGRERDERDPLTPRVKVLLSSLPRSEYGRHLASYQPKKRRAGCCVKTLQK